MQNSTLDIGDIRIAALIATKYGLSTQGLTSISEFRDMMQQYRRVENKLKQNPELEKYRVKWFKTDEDKTRPVFALFTNVDLDMFGFIKLIKPSETLENGVVLEEEVIACPFKLDSPPKLF